MENLDKDITEKNPAKKGGTWHQATNSLRLVLCNRGDKACKPSNHNTVFIAIVHRKLPNILKLPLRYERYFIVWEASPPFSMLGISKHPLLMANETASGWSPSENWDDDASKRETVSTANNPKHNAMEEKVVNATQPYIGKGYWAYFTYTVSISYAWGRERDEVEDKNVGYLDDEVVLSIGVDDKGQTFARVGAGDLVQCLRACEGKPGF